MSYNINSGNNNNIDLLLSCFSKYVFSQAKESIRDLKYYFSTNPATSGNPLVSGLLDAIETYDLDAIGLPLFNSILAKSQVSPAEYQSILDRVVEFKKYTKEQMLPIKKYLSDVIASTWIDKASQQYRDNPTEFINYIKNVNLKSSDDVRLSSINFNDLDINSILAQENENIVMSKFDFINKSFPNGGYPRSSTIIVSAPPGVGKSLFLTEETLWMALNGTKVLYGIFGDIGMRDMLIRMCAIYSGFSFNETNHRLPELYKSLRDALRGNFEISVNPAGQVSVEEFVEFSKNSPAKVIVADYDSNLTVETGKNDSMYDLYGSMYMKFSELVAEPYNKLLFVASQPKIVAWGNPIIGLTDIGESSRKQHAADMIITKGKEVSSPNHLSIINIPKNRRGEVDLQAYSIRLSNGRTKIVPRAVYKELLQYPEKKEFLDSEIDMMIAAHLRAQGSINAAIDSRIAGQQQQRPSGALPF
jgi:hypothetical protein